MIRPHRDEKFIRPTHDDNTWTPWDHIVGLKTFCQKSKLTYPPTTPAEFADMYEPYMAEFDRAHDTAMTAEELVDFVNVTIRNQGSMKPVLAVGVANGYRLSWVIRILIGMGVPWESILTALTHAQGWLYREWTTPEHWEAFDDWLQGETLGRDVSYRRVRDLIGAPYNFVHGRTVQRLAELYGYRLVGDNGQPLSWARGSGTSTKERKDRMVNK